ncbi:MAG: F0F1 ATP synthase subunit B [Sphingobacteriaceae bacterium]
MELVTPSIGLIVWQTLAFLLLFFLLAKFAWKPVMQAINERERSIDDALEAAKKAKEEMARLTSENEALLKQARVERDVILKEAKTLKDQIVAEAKTTAQVEGAKLIEKAKQEIDSQKSAALAEVKNQVASLSLEIAEKVLNKQFEDQKKQESLVGELLKEVKL